MQNVVYVLQSVPKKNSIYVGFTNNLKQRLHKHNGLIGGGSKKTRRASFQPWKLMMYVTCPEDWFDQVEALRLEYQLTYCKKFQNETKFHAKGQPGFTKKVNHLIHIMNRKRWSSKSPLRKDQEVLIFVDEQYVNQLQAITCLWKPIIHPLHDEWHDVLNEYRIKLG